MKVAALIAFMSIAAYYFLSASVPLLKSQCRPTVKVYCGHGRIGHKALVDGIIEVRCADN